MATTLRRSVARAFGPFAITWWTWLVTLPFALTVMSGVQYVHGGPAEVLAVAGLQHAILGGLLLLGAGVLRRVGGHARPVAVIAVFALIGAARPVLFLEAGGLLGIPVVTGDLAGRMTINVVVVTVMFALVAAGVDLVHEHRGVFRRLRAAQSAADRDGDWASERLARLRNTAVDEVMTALEDAAETASAHRMDPAEAARLLRRLAEDVVRPASHRVYDDEVGAGTPEPEPPRFGEWPASLLAGMRAAPPVSTVLLFTGLVLPFALILVGPVSILPLAVGLIVLVGAGVGISALPLPKPVVPRVLVLVLLQAAVGVLLAAVCALGLLLAGGDPSWAWFQAITYPVVALAVAFVVSLSIRVRQDQAELESALQANIAATARVRSEYERERAALARLLHAGVQSELIAGALSLTASPGNGPVTAAQRIAEVVGRAGEALRGGNQEPHAADEVRALIDSWSSAIDLRARIGDAVWERLGDPQRASAVVDTLSEGLANAVRHGDGSAVEVELRPTGADGVELLIQSGGALGATRPGIGLRQLAERGTVALREAAGRVELAVVIP